MPDFAKRSDSKELLDGNAIPFEDIRQNMEELDAINHRLGGHRITILGVKAILKKWNNSSPVHVVEIGCGGGDNLRVVKNWGVQKGLQFQLTGIDINPECIRFAQEKKGNEGMQFICADYREAVLTHQPDIVFSSLFCHHFTDAELVAQLTWMRQNSSLGFFINDLHRHPLAYYSMQFLTKAFSKSYLVKNDAPLSVMRGFKRKEWKTLLKEAGLQNTNVQWQWAFRWLILSYS
ncbi:MAG: SAM-dependent methyltransferase [Flaviaesturariibacter sp.]|nr:SAM-dependent methyltransferase [Flaviaesturariibacter sp.]